MRIPTGIEGLDELIEGGLLSERVYLVSGPPGCGKTTFGMQFLIQGASQGEVGLYVTLLESPQNIIDDISNYAINLPSLIKSRKVLFADLGPRLEYGYMDEMHDIITPEYEVGHASLETDAPSPAMVYKEISNYVREYNVKRLVIDSLSAIRFTTKDTSLEEKEMSRFIRHLKKLGCTTVLISEMTDPQAYTTEQFASHGVIFLHNFLYDKSMIRALQIIKMRGTMHDCDMRRMDFTGRGLKIFDLLK
ncbi:putative circadian clock protein, KaiC [Methanosalsum zhilinae DSM 4017]|uniref:Putative circadian clock protein, KaiC n=1 Tax=Methanosalsum zhilinae (strain DSM 4017 / NBRC 107636 / OCM 62 / WeN5) TaxID=679901 RepID=F7XMH2_METZD|nr:ATPase domain-containing protein [Methanosalsum zhilinae]AEH59895.1 putative circadian clock protein, KaiC [Methanosalsum zhilinae DSM 4017]